MMIGGRAVDSARSPSRLGRTSVWPAAGQAAVRSFARRRAAVRYRRGSRPTVGGDPWLRAIDKATGEVLQEIELPGTQNGHPITYEVDGRQFIVMSVGGRGQVPELVALAIPAS